MDVLKVTIDVHGGPGKSHHTRSEFEFQVFEVGLEQVLGDWLDLTKNVLVLVEDVLKFVEVHLELFFLQKDDSRSFGDLDMLSFKAFSFTDELEDSDIEVHIEGTSVRLSNDKGGL